MIPRYTLPEMGAIWTDQARFEQMLRVEIAVARAQVSPRLVGADAVRAIESRARVDVDRIAEIEKTTDHDVIAFVAQVAETVGEEGRFLHLGLTSSDVVDTGLALQLQAAGRRLVEDADALIAALVARAKAEAGTVMMGRTHSVHAEPTTMGMKIAGWAFEIARDRVRLAAAADDAATGKISGPVGTYSHLEPDLEEEVLAALGLHRDPISTQIVQRDRHAALIAAIAITGGSLERIATESPEPPAHRDRRADGAVPRRPEGLERDAPQAQPDPVRADRGHGPAAARLRGRGDGEPAALARARHQPLVAPSACCCPTRRSCSTTCSSRRAGLIERLVVRPERMRENIERGLGLHCSSRVLLALVEQGGLSREDAYAIVQRNSLRAADERRQLRDLLLADPEVAERLSDEALDACFDDAHFLRNVAIALARLDDLIPAREEAAGVH